MTYFDDIEKKKFIVTKEMSDHVKKDHGGKLPSAGECTTCDGLVSSRQNLTEILNTPLYNNKYVR